MANSVFFSWQSDTPTRVGRNFLREALEGACAEIATEPSIEEALRDKLAVDSDTQGVAGQPPIAETILKKIDAAAVFVADMTFTGTRLDGRPTPNPNVLIEYGWALKSLGHSRVISVMNDAYGTPSADTLPFDLAHVRWPARFSLPVDASAQKKAEAKRKLVATLKTAIRTCLSTIPSPPSQPLPIFPKAIPKDGPARFRNANEELGFYDGVASENIFKVYLRPGPAIWLRIMPSTPPIRIWESRELKEVALKDNTLNLFPIVGGSGYSWLRAEDGWGVYPVSDTANNDKQKQETAGIVFVFGTGEIWSIDTAWLTYSAEHMPFIEDEFNARFANYARFINALGVPPPYHWIAGLTGVKGRQLAGVPTGPGYMIIGQGGPLCLSETIQAEGTYTAGQSPADALRHFYRSIFEKCGVERPTHLDQKMSR